MRALQFARFTERGDLNSTRLYAGPLFGVTYLSNVLEESAFMEWQPLPQNQSRDEVPTVVP